MKKRKVQVVIYYCAKDNKKHFLLLKVNERRGFFWQNVTGGVDKDEKFKHAALREAKEETNIKKSNIVSITKTDLKFKFISRYGKVVKEKVFILQCREPWKVALDPLEHCEFKWVEEDKIVPQSVQYPTNYEALLKALEIKC